MVEAATNSDFCGYHLSEKKAGRLMVGPLWPRTIAIAVSWPASSALGRVGMGTSNLQLAMPLILRRGCASIDC